MQPLFYSFETIDKAIGSAGKFRSHFTECDWRTASSFNGKPQATVSSEPGRLRLAVQRGHWVEAEKRTVLPFNKESRVAGRFFTPKYR